MSVLATVLSFALVLALCWFPSFNRGCDAAAFARIDAKAVTRDKRDSQFSKRHLQPGVRAKQCEPLLYGKEGMIVDPKIGNYIL